MTKNSGTNHECSDCGAPIEQGDHFCKKCGAKLDWPDEQIISEPIKTAEAPNDAVKPRFWKKLGWGWYVLLGITYVGTQKNFAKYGVYNGLIVLVAVVIALTVYFLVRSKYLKKVAPLWKCSLYSGIIAFIVAGFITAFLANFIPTQDHRVAQIIQTENITLQSNKS